VSGPIFVYSLVLQWATAPILTACVPFMLYYVRLGSHIWFWDDLMAWSLGTLVHTYMYGAIVNFRMSARARFYLGLFVVTQVPLFCMYVLESIAVMHGMYSLVSELLAGGIPTFTITAKLEQPNLQSSAFRRTQRIKPIG